MFEKASKIKLRFPSSKGMLTTEDLWDLSLTQLNSLAKELNKKVKESAEPDFLEVKSDSDTIAKLQFDIVIQVLTKKKEEGAARAEAAANKAKNARILELISKKQDAALENLSEDELRKLLTP